MFERFTDRARRVLVLAQEEARVLNHNFIGTEHILLGLIHEGEGVACKALGSLGMGLEAACEKVEETVGTGWVGHHRFPPVHPRAKKVLELSLREALQLDHNYIGTEHMLLALVREGEGVAARVLVSLGVDLSRVRQQVIQLLSGYQSPGHESITSGAFGPRCPSCRALLEGQVTYRVLTVKPVEASVGVGACLWLLCTASAAAPRSHTPLREVKKLCRVRRASRPLIRCPARRTKSSPSSRLDGSASQARRRAPKAAIRT